MYYYNESFSCKLYTTIESLAQLSRGLPRTKNLVQGTKKSITNPLKIHKSKKFINPEKSINPAKNYKSTINPRKSKIMCQEEECRGECARVR